MPDNQIYIVKTLHGLENVLAEELHEMGAEKVEILKRAVSFEGDKALLYRANYELRTALRVLMPVHEFHARDEKQFYARIRDDINWGHFLDVNETLAVDAVVRSEVFRHSQYMALTVKDAIVDQFRDRLGRRPSVNTEAPTLRVHLHIHENRCELLLDTSGESLHKRGYRKEQLEAPLNEVLAAGMLKLAGWKGESDFVDPMCGSGTLPIEALLMARNISPQKIRPNFGFQRWKDFDKKLWQKVKTESDAREQSFDFQIFASDKEGRARNATTINLMALGLENEVVLERKAFEQMDAPAERGLLMSNPPYDERMKVEEVEKFYALIGSRLKHTWQGWNAWLISSNREALHAVGLRPNRKIQLFNGALECIFHKYEMYEGKKFGGKDKEEPALNDLPPSEE